MKCKGFFFFASITARYLAPVWIKVLNFNKTEFMCFNQKRIISTLNGKPQRLLDQFTYLGSNISSTESDVNIYPVKTWNIRDRLLIIWKSNLSNKIKWDFFQAVSILLHRCTTWTLTKHMEKKLDGKYTRMLHAVLNKSWKQHSTCMAAYLSSHKPFK